MNKDWYKSKTMWVAVIGAAGTIIQAAGMVEAFPPIFWQILGATGLYTLRDGIGFEPGKSPFASKTVWTSIVAAGVAILDTTGTVGAVPAEAWTALSAFGLYSVRDAVK